MARRRRGGLADIDYETLANRVAERVWGSNVDFVTGTTITVGTSSGAPVTGDRILADPNTFRVHDIAPEQEWRYDTATIAHEDPRILILQEKVEELEKTLKMVGQLLDEHIKRTNPVPTDRKRRSIILDQEVA